MRKWWKSTPSGLTCLIIVVAMFCYMGSIMGTSHMFNTIMNTAHELLLNTVFYLMGICVLTGAIGKIFVEFGVVDLLEKLLRPLMRPLFNLPGVAALGAVMTFLSDNPAIITLSRDEHFSSFFKKYQFISLTNFGTAFGMGLIVIIFMIGQGFTIEPFIGLAGAFVGSIISTRVEHAQSKSLFVRILNSLLDGGRSGVDIGVAIIPGVLIISTFVMILTFGPSTDGTYTGAAYEGTQTLPWLASQLDFVFEALFGFTDSHQVVFPITALGAVGAALGLVPSFLQQGWLDGNAIAVCTAIGMCWSGFLSTHTAMLDSLGYRQLTSKAIISHTIGGLCAAIFAHWCYVLYMLL